MADPKPFASLSSGLLARKGAARPAMRPQGFGAQSGAGLEDLGWNDMGFEPPKASDPPRDESHDAFGEDVVGHPRYHPTGLTPVQSPVHTQQAEIAERYGPDEEVDEEFDETAELYDPNATDETDEAEEAEEELEAEPQFEAGPEAAFEPETSFEPQTSFEPEPSFEPELAAEFEPAEFQAQEPA